jgi:hypothetical protein
MGGRGQDSSRLERMTWHICRHTFASRLVMAGVDLKTVQVLGGWRRLKMVLRYAHLSPTHLLAAVERLGSANRTGPRDGRSGAPWHYEETTSCQRDPLSFPLPLGRNHVESQGARP